MTSKTDSAKINTAIKNIKYATIAFDCGDLERAELNLLQAQRSYPTQVAEEFVKCIRELKQTQNEGNRSPSDKTEIINRYKIEVYERIQAKAVDLGKHRAGQIFGSKIKDYSNKSFSESNYKKDNVLTDTDITKQTAEKIQISYDSNASTSKNFDKVNFSDNKSENDTQVKLNNPKKSDNTVETPQDDSKKSNLSSSYTKTYKDLDIDTENKKSEAEKCIKIAKRAIADKNFEKAKKFLSKAKNIYPITDVSILLREVQELTGDEELNAEKHCENINNAKKEETQDIHKEEIVKATRQILPEHIEAIQRINLESDDPFEILGLSKDLTALKLRKEILKLKKSLHPDRNPAPGAEAAFIAMNNAVNQLKLSKTL